MPGLRSGQVLTGADENSLGPQVQHSTVWPAPGSRLASLPPISTSSCIAPRYLPSCPGSPGTCFIPPINLGTWEPISAATKNVSICEEHEAKADALAR